MERLALFHNLVNLAAADGKFTDEEVQFLAQRAELWAIPDDEFETALAGVAAGQLQIRLPEAQQQRVQL
ncbi:MAG: hypothetical protein GTO41_19570, partial [Burkholderiales bacterium]|nr:hypothetical protein [Burkholderiales bacterium]